MARWYLPRSLAMGAPSIWDRAAIPPTVLSRLGGSLVAALGIVLTVLFLLGVLGLGAPDRPDGAAGVAVGATIALCALIGLAVVRRLETARVRRLERVFRNHMRDTVILSTLADRIDASVIVTDRAGRIDYVNPGFTRLTGWSAEEALGRTPGDLLAGPKTDPEVQDYMTAAVAEGRPFQVEVLNYARDGREIWLSIDCEVLADETGAPIGYMGVQTDLTERRAVEARLERLAYADAVTGLPNRAKFLETLGTALSSGLGPAVVMIDLTRLWLTRNSFGHDFADGVLRALAQRLGPAFGEREGLAFLGRDDFAGFFIAQSEDEVRARAGGLEELLRRPVAVGDTEIFLPAWIGVALPDRGTTEAADLLRDAETAASQARALNLRQPLFFDLGMRARLIERQKLETALRRAIYLRDGLWVAFQPIVHMASGRLAGFEALARWRPAGRPPVPPGEFIPLAETTGMIVPLSSFVFAEACHRIARMQAARAPGQEPLFVSVNLSAHQILQPNFAQWVARVLKATGVDPSWVKLEITEGALVSEAERVFPLLQSLRDQGFRIAIDDFGTGYSSLAYLHRLPIDEIKIDRAFVKDLESRPEMRKIVGVIAELGVVLDLKVVAEGIETLGELRSCRDLSCHFGQGFLFAQGLTPEAAQDLVATGPTWSTWEPPAYPAPVVTLRRDPRE